MFSQKHVMTKMMMMTMISSCENHFVISQPFRKVV